MYQDQLMRAGDDIVVLSYEKCLSIEISNKSIVSRIKIGVSMF